MRILSTKTAIYGSLAAVLVLLVLAGRIAQRAYDEEHADYVRTPSTEVSRHPEQAGIPGLGNVSFAAKGDPQVAAWYAPSSNRAAVILVHGTEAERSSLLPELRDLAEAGFGVLAIDMPGQGASSGRTYWGEPERRAISAGVDWLSKRADVDPARIGAFGLSMGGYVLAQAAVTDPRIEAVVLAAAPHDVKEFNWVATDRWGWLTQIPTYVALRDGGTPLDMRPKDIVGDISPRPLMIVYGDQDHLVKPWMEQQIFDAANEPKEFFTVHGATHGDYAKVAPAEYKARLVTFFTKALRADLQTGATTADAAAPQAGGAQAGTAQGGATDPDPASADPRH
jgi:dipeptidyl aminopeptidase/acylaminoacyl peptidase